MTSGVVGENGSSQPLEITGRRDLILFTLGIEKVKEQQSLLLGICGSADGDNWQVDPLVEFPQRFYTGLSAVVLDSAAHSDIRFLRAQWKVSRWGRGDKVPMFQLYLIAEPLRLD